jgi:hypothetical protein
MTLSNDEGEAIEHFAVRLDLRIEPPQAVAIRFDLVTVHQTIHNGEINASKSAR